MADGDDSTPKGQEGGQPPVDNSKIFSNGYNEGVSTQEKRVLTKFSELTGQDFSDLDDVYSWTKTSSQKLAESISDPTATDEYKDLNNRFKDLKTDYEKAQQRAEQINQQYKFDSTFNSVASQIEESSEFKIPKSDVKDLFQSRYSIENKDGKQIIKKRADDTPLMGENGYKTLDEALSEFSKTYTKPATQGTGGGSGDGGSVKPSHKEFVELNNANKPEEADRLLDQAIEAGGWKEPDAPTIE